MQKWQLQDAKSRFSELVKFVQQEPVAITVHGMVEAIIISTKDFNKLKPQLTLGQFLDKSPLKGLDISFERDRSLPKETNLFGNEE
jgi:prevent-host-death family protein